MEFTILAASCGAIGLGCMAAAGYALLGGKDVAAEQIFAIMIWGLLGAVFLGAAALIAREGPLKGMGKKADTAPGGDAPAAS
ncbi:MAG: hypothetical protein EXQ56_08675 [Acidobacteria bacterium]|nr:hypothetical protein [Acidobacteriota bacterium]